MNSISRNIQIANHCGFCYGVRRAVETTKKIRLENPNKNIFILGELIHNSHVICELESLGIKTVNCLDSCCNNNSICIIRSHGESIDVINQIKGMGYEVIDLTCPDVKKVQEKAMAMVQDGYFLLILGKPEHPEVIAIEKNAKNIDRDSVLVAKNLDEIKQNENLLKKRKVGIVVQTTQKLEFLKDAVNCLLDIASDLKIANTICHSTYLRQNEAKVLGENSDLMIVVGSKKSANTTHLAEILQEITHTIHIENENELDNFTNVIQKSQNIGITAGASTPDYIIQKVKNKLERI